jgi:hypothetical protein
MNRPDAAPDMAGRSTPRSYRPERFVSTSCPSGTSTPCHGSSLAWCAAPTSTAALAGRMVRPGSCSPQVSSAIDQLSWPRKSPTKQQVARQHNPEPPQPTLFETFASEEIAGLEIAPQGDLELDLPTYVVAHSVDPLGRQMELVLVVRLNPGGGQAWYWRQDLLEIPPNGGGSRLAGNVLTPTGPNNVPDVPVRLCRPADQHRDSQASGEQ